MNKKNNSKPKIIDLYAGVGGLSLGAIRAGFDLALAVEWDKHAMKAHKVNFPDYKHSDEDISKLSGAKLLKIAKLSKGKLDGLIGGPPCQGFSNIGGQNILDPRNDLFVKFFQLVNECKPRFFVAENVPGIMHSKYAEIRKKAFDYVQKDYEMLEPIKFKASDFGAATSRERVFFIGYRRNSKLKLSKQDFEKQKTKKITTVSQALRGLPKQIRSDWLSESQGWRAVKSNKTEYYRKYVDGNIPVGMGDQSALKRYWEEGLISGNLGTYHTLKVKKRLAKLKQGQSDSVSRAIRLKADGLCPTLRAGTGTDKGSYQAIRPIHPTVDRVITPREAARLQGFPDWFQFAPSKWHSFRQIGNSVSPVVSEALLRVIFCQLVNERKRNNGKI